MSEMLKHIKNDEELLMKIEGVYADFGYPEDMKHLIYYMPLEDQEKNDEYIYLFFYSIIPCSVKSFKMSKYFVWVSVAHLLTSSLPSQADVTPT